MTDQHKTSPKPASIPAPTRDPRLGLRQQFFPIASLEEDEGAQFEVRFLEQVLEKDPCNEDALMLLGHVYTRRGEYERGLTLDERLVRLRPADPTAYYNLACSYSLVGKVEDAIQCLEKAVTLGYRDIAHLLKDPDLQHLRNDARFRQFVHRLLHKNPSNS